MNRVHHSNPSACVQLRTVMHQAIEHVRRFVTRRRHYLDMVGIVLIGEVSVEADFGLNPK
jgi:hypothetical protein